MPSPVLAESTSESLERIKIAVIEGTARSIRHQQQQLTKLYNGLLKARSGLQKALQQEHALTESEALFEHSLTLQDIRTHYDGLSMNRENSKATKTERGEDNPDYASPHGIVYIIPSSGLYSIISPLVAAFVAGNCAVVELPRTTSTLTASLRNLFNEILSRDTFTTTTHRPNLNSLDSCLIVCQGSVNDFPQTSMRTIFPIQGKVVSFVDREADLALAARSIFRSRFHFGRKSAYATEITFIHEAAMDIFKRHLAQLWIELSFSSHNIDRNRLQQEEHEGFLMVQAGCHGAVVEIEDRPNNAPLPQFANPTLILCSMSSTDTGIDLCAEICGNEPPSAAFIFATQGSAKYLSRHVEAQLTTINHIPLELLVGPRIPNANPKGIFPRYSAAIFQHCRPQFSNVSEASKEVGGVVLDNIKLLSWANSLQGPLPDSGEKDGKRVDFFEQAIMTAAGISLSTVIAITVTLLLGKRS